MSDEVWLGRVEVRQKAGIDHKIVLSGAGAFVWITCWACDFASYCSKVSQVMDYYGLAIAGVEEAMPFNVAEERGRVADGLLEQLADTMQDAISVSTAPFIVIKAITEDRPDAAIVFVRH